MIRNPEGLILSVRSKVEAWVSACAAQGVEVLVYCTRRTPEEQAKLYAQGRTEPGRIVTNARPWESAHQYGRAVDAVPLLAGKPVWKYTATDPLWAVMVAEAESAGLEWAGRWKRFKEQVHFQDLGGQSVADLLTSEGPTAT